MTELPPLRKISLALGGPVNLDDVVGRDEVIASWWAEVPRTSLRLTEPRRMSKTTTLQLMARRPPAGWHCLFDTVQDAFTVVGLVEKTLGMIGQHSSLGERAKQRVSQLGKFLPHKVQGMGFGFELAADLRQAPLDILERAMSDLYEQLVEQDQRILIIWDEFTDCIASIRDTEGVQQAVQVLMRFRALRERVCRDRIRWILSGSVGLHHVLRTLPRTASLNNVNAIHLGPLDQSTATWLTQCLGLGLDFKIPPASAVLLAEASSGIPFVLETMVHEIHVRRLPVPTTAAEAKDILILAADHMDDDQGLVPLLERIDKYYGEDWKTARAILDAVSQKPYNRRSHVQIRN